MFKYIVKCLKRIICAVLFIYAYNRMSSPINIYIPFNYITIAFVSFFGFPSLIALILFSFLYL